MFSLKQDQRGLGIYLHFPYCSQRCPYCDFTLTTGRIPHQLYLEASKRELGLRLEELKTLSWQSRPLTSVYIGGGTPSLWAPEALRDFIECCKGYFQFLPDIEITLEANPAELNLALLQSYQDMGVNRISLGVQSMRKSTLEKLGRNHSPEQVEEVIEYLKLVGIKNVSIDLIHGLSGEGIQEALSDLEAVLKLKPKHISLYQLTIEEKTLFGHRALRGETLLEPDESLLEIYQALSKRLQLEGMPLYEVSNASRPEDQAKHNSLYWTMGDYIGIGTGAHGRVTLPQDFNRSIEKGLRWQNIRSPKNYVKHLTAPDTNTRSMLQSIEEERAWLDAEALNEEAILVGLRLEQGLVLTESLYHRYASHAETLIKEGLLAFKPANQEEPWGRWYATQRGRELLDYLCTRLILG